MREILAQGGKVKIISPIGQLEKRVDKRNLDALRRMEENGAEVRIHRMLHARIFFIIRDTLPWRVIIDSGDLKTYCFGGARFDAGIWSNHPDIMKSTIDFSIGSGKIAESRS